MKALLLCLVLTGVAVAQPFTTGSYTPGCASYLTVDGQNRTWTCWPMGTVFGDGTLSYTGFVITLAKDGTFVGSFYSDYGLADFSAPFHGTWTGVEEAPGMIQGSFSGGSVTEQMGYVTRGGYKGTKIKVWSVTSGSGVLQ